MIAKNRAQLKAWIKNMSSRVDVNENIILQNYMLERLLERISVSDYKYKFVLKGGMLITAIVGIDMRNTLDMDATIKGFDLEKDNLENILDDIFKIDLDDGVTFEFRGIKEIVETDEVFPEYVIIGEPTDNKIITGCKGLLAVKVYTYGNKVHSSRPDKGKNANSIMIRLLNELEIFYESIIKKEKNSKFEVPYTTMNIGLINGGNSINSLADKCETYIDFRIMKDEHISIIKEKLQNLCEKYDATFYVDLEILPFFNHIDFISKQETAGFMTEASFIKAKRIILGPRTSCSS